MWMAEFTLKVRRFKPEEAEGPYWESFDVDLDPTLSVLDGLLQAKDRDDGSLAVRCSCRAAICGSCGVKIYGQSTLACKSMLDVTQSMACIQCGACVSSCLSMEADPDFIRPAALAKAYRFVGDPRDAETKERLHD